MIFIRLHFHLAGLIGLIFAGSVRADSVTLYPSADTSLFEAAPDNNLGSNSNLVSGANGSEFRGRALIRFDLLGQIPSNAVIQSVALTLNVVIVPGGGGVGSIYDLRRWLVDWQEGVGTGNPGALANDGETTWNNRLHPSTPWSEPGGANDLSATVSAATFINSPGTYTFASTPELVADVQQWLQTPSTNFGWGLISESESTAFTARRFGSREDTNNAPVLTVQFARPSAPDIEGIQMEGSQVQFSFLAAAGEAYSIQFQDALSPGDWLNLTNISRQVAPATVIIVDFVEPHARRFYRIAH